MKKMQTEPKRKSKTLRELSKIYGFGFFLACIIMVVAYQFVAPAPPKKLTIATASKEGAYYAFAREYKEYFAKENIELEILETSGSVENLGLLADKKVEVAFLQGGVGGEADYPSIKGLASLYLEPLWIYVRSDLEVTTFQDLAGKHLAIGAEGSGTRKIVLQLLEDNNLLAGKKMRLSPFSGKEGAQQLLAGQIDALFMVTRAGTPLVKDLFLDPRAKLVSLKRAESYSRLHGYLSHIVLPEGVLDMAQNIPDRNIHFIAPAATLVANDDLHPALIDLLRLPPRCIMQKR